MKRFGKTGNQIAALSAGLALALVLAVSIRAQRHARVDGRLDEIAAIQREIFRRQPIPQLPRSPLVRRIEGYTPIVHRALTTDGAYPTLISVYQQLVRRFDQDYPRSGLGGMARTRFRIYAAFALNLEGDFDGALRSLESHEVNPKPRADLESLARITADARFGLKDWIQALANYREARSLGDNKLYDVLRISQCLDSMGKRSEAAAAYSELAERLHESGLAFFFADQSTRASAHFEKGIAILENAPNTTESSERLGLTADLQTSAGHALTLEDNLSTAIRRYESAAESLSERLQRTQNAEDARKLARSIARQGAALLGMGKASEAADSLLAANQLADEYHSQAPIGDDRSRGILRAALAAAHIGQNRFDEAGTRYSEALAILSPQSQDSENSHLAYWRALCQVNLAATAGSQKSAEKAESRLSQAIHRIGQSLESPDNANASSLLEPMDLELVSAIGYSDLGLDISTSPIVGFRDLSREFADLLALAYRNRGFIRLDQRNETDALSDFDAATDILTKLIEREGSVQLYSRLARTLTASSFLRATTQIPALRDKTRAVDDARKAVEITRGQSYLALYALAAAESAAGDVEEATRLLRQAVKVAPANAQAQLQAQIEALQD